MSTYKTKWFEHEHICGPDCLHFICVCLWESLCVCRGMGGWWTGGYVWVQVCMMHVFFLDKYIYMLSYLLHHQIHNYPQKSQECHELLTAEPGLGYLRHLTPWKIFLITLHLYQAWLKTSPSSPFLALMPFCMSQTVTPFLLTCLHFSLHYLDLHKQLSV